MQKKTALITFRLKPAIKRAATKAARAKGLTLSQFIASLLEAAARRKAKAKK